MQEERSVNTATDDRSVLSIAYLVNTVIGSNTHVGTPKDIRIGQAVVAVVSI